MEPQSPADWVAEVDARENEERGDRLAELNSLLPDGVVGFSGLAAQWLFADVKATWIYAYFTGTVLTAYAFCMHQLAGLLRMWNQDADLPATSESLDELAAIGERHGVIDLDLRARLVALHDAARPYLTVGLHASGADLVRRMTDAEDFTEEHTLLADARVALECSVALLHRQF